MSDGINDARRACTESRRMAARRQERVAQLQEKIANALKELEAEVGVWNWLEIALDVLHDVKWRKR